MPHRPRASSSPDTSAPAAAWEYAPAPESTKVEIADRYGHFIDGEFVAQIGRAHV